MSKRRTHSPEFKARVTMEAIIARKTIQEIATHHAINPTKSVNGSSSFWMVPVSCSTRGSKSKHKDRSQTKVTELFQQIRRLQMELEWLKKSQLL
jgi:transposase-like protein